MNANELRIGNLLLMDYLGENSYTSLVTAINGCSVWIDLEGEIEEGLSSSHEISPEYLKGIPLTEEWLLKFGFIKQFLGYRFPENDSVFTKTGRWVCMDFMSRSELETPFFRFDGITDIYSVHQLQNFYFIIIGEELQIKEL